MGTSATAVSILSNSMVKNTMMAAVTKTRTLMSDYASHAVSSMETSSPVSDIATACVDAVQFVAMVWFVLVLL